MTKLGRLHVILLAAAMSLLGSAAPAAPREYQVFHTDHPPVIDGDVRDDIWRAVPWSGDFTGLQGAAADVKTRFAMAWDEKFLYVAVRCEEPAPEMIHADVAGHDSRIVNDDHIEILIASSDKPAFFLQIFLNAGRGRMDQWIDETEPEGDLAPPKRPLRPEQAGLDSAARVQAGEWVLEAAIPLAKVGFPLKEGATYVGNICRVRPAGAVSEMAWNPAQGGLRKSAGFGVFKLGGPAPLPPPIQAGDAVLLRNGDLIKGKLLRLADGKTQFSSPTFAEPVSFSAAEMQRLDLAWTQADAAPSRFILNNGEEISGRIAALSAETVGIESPSLGRISFPRGFLAHISFSGLSIESHFETGILKPWEAISGGGSFKDGLLHLSGESGTGGQYQLVLSLPLHQDQTVTLIADCEAPPRNALIRIELFADRAHPQMQVRNGLMFQMLTAGAVGFAALKDGQPLLQPGPLKRMELGAGLEHLRIKVAYNPADGHANAWFNGKPAAEVTVPGGPTEGEFVVFGTTQPLTLRRLAVYCGLPPPDEAADGPKSGELLAWLSNGDTVRASQVEFKDGNFVFTTEFGPVKLSPDRVLNIAFPSAAAQPPAEGAAWVETSSSRFALEVREINGEFVIGRSPEFGEVRLPRPIVKSIAFPAS